MADSIKNRESVSTSPGHRDGVSPTPWRKAVPNWNGRSIIWDAIGAIVTTDTRDADAALIVEAVNERDRLRDIVRRLEDEYEQMEERDTVCNTDRVRRIEALFREAREALGEEVPNE